MQIIVLEICFIEGCQEGCSGTISPSFSLFVYAVAHKVADSTLSHGPLSSMTKMSEKTLHIGGSPTISNVYKESPMFHNLFFRNLLQEWLQNFQEEHH